jgi:hypothetical protein
MSVVVLNDDDDDDEKLIFPWEYWEYENINRQYSRFISADSVYFALMLLVH